SHLAGALSLQDSVTALTDKPPSGKASADRLTDPELTASAVRLTAELAAWRLAAAITQTAAAAPAPALQTVLQQATTQQRWLLDGRGQEHPRRAVKLASVLTSIEPTDDPPTRETNGYDSTRGETGTMKRKDSPASVGLGNGRYTITKIIRNIRC